MSTLGQKPATTHVSFQKQTITGNGGTSYTLQQSVGSELDIAVFVNNTRQEPTTAYTASGTSLVMTGAVNSSDSFYVIFLAKAINTTGLPVSAVNTASINANAVTNDKIANSTIDLTSKVTGVLPIANGGTGTSSTATVSMAAYKWGYIDQDNSNTTIAASSITLNIGSDLASNGRYTCPVAGVYRATIFGMCGVDGSNSNSGTFEVYLSLNDAYPSDGQYKKYVSPAATYSHFSANILISVSANDTLEWGILANNRTLHSDYGQATFKLEHAT